MTDTDESGLSAAQAVFRFVLELLAIASWAIVGWNVIDGAVRWAAAIALPVVAAGAWGTFRASGDHSAGGGAPVAVHGAVRLILELGVLLGAAVAVALVWRWTFGVALAVAVLAHYASTMRRVGWLLQRRT